MAKFIPVTEDLLCSGGCNKVLGTISTNPKAPVMTDKMRRGYWCADCAPTRAI